MKIFLTSIIGLIVIIVAFLIWSSMSRPVPQQKNSADIVTTSSLHAHPTLFMYIKGVSQEIPANIGVGPQYAEAPRYDSGMQMTAIHTHDDMPIIHLEFPSGPVYKEDIGLGQFFKIWGKDMRSFGTNLKMMVNGIENTEYEAYSMKDGDKIELQYD